MAEIRFTQSDGPIRLQFASHDAIIQGKGSISYKPHIRNLKAMLLGKPHKGKLRALDVIAKILAVLSAVGALGLFIWKWKEGASTPPFVSLGANVLSVALVGSLIGLGGVNLFSLEGRLSTSEELLAGNRNENEKQLHEMLRHIDEHFAILSRRCPFEEIFTPNHQLNGISRPGDPNFCVKCPLGIDQSSQQEDGLMHNCHVYHDLHVKWKRLASR